jgi:hypothetical protein
LTLLQTHFCSRTKHTNRHRRRRAHTPSGNRRHRRRRHSDSSSGSSDSGGSGNDDDGGHPVRTMFDSKAIMNFPAIILEMQTEQTIPRTLRPQTKADMWRHVYEQHSSSNSNSNNNNNNNSNNNNNNGVKFTMRTSFIDKVYTRKGLLKTKPT